MIEPLAFFLFSGLLIGAGVAILLEREVVRCAIWLLAALGASAGLFFLLGAYFLAVAQLILYAGGTLVLMIFGVMLTARSAFGPQRAPRREILLACVTSAVLCASLLAVLVPRASSAEPRATSVAADSAGMHSVGRQLLTTYLLPFELVSVLLVAVMIGAANVARVRREAGHA